MKFDLNADERDALADVAQSYGWPSLVKAIEQLVLKQEQAVLTHNIEDGVDRLVHAKLRAEGARKLRHDIEALAKLLKKSAK